jgi:hypothetical protein
MGDITVSVAGNNPETRGVTVNQWLEDVSFHLAKGYTVNEFKNIVLNSRLPANQSEKVDIVIKRIKTFTNSNIALSDKQINGISKILERYGIQTVIPKKSVSKLPPARNRTLDDLTWATLEKWQSLDPQPVNRMHITKPHIDFPNPPRDSKPPKDTPPDKPTQDSKPPKDTPPDKPTHDDDIVLFSHASNEFCEMLEQIVDRIRKARLDSSVTTIVTDLLAIIPIYIEENPGTIKIYDQIEKILRKHAWNFESEFGGFLMYPEKDIILSDFNALLKRCQGASIC